MNKSETITKLAEALSKFQSEVEGAKKDSNNPFYKSKYADLAQIWKTVREPLTKNGLSVSQVGLPSEPEYINVETVLLHSSGEWISGITSLKLVKNDPQGAGSAITYARRYGLSAILGIHQEDDDANSHIKSEQSKQAKQPAPIVEITTNPETEMLEIKKAISGMLTKMVDDNVDGFGDEARRHNSFTKHLNSDTVRDCTDYNALLAYHDHLAAKLRGETAKPTIRQRQDALIDRLTAMPIMAEELEEWGDKIRNATRHAALDEVEEWITKYEVKQ